MSRKFHVVNTEWDENDKPTQRITRVIAAGFHVRDGAVIFHNAEGTCTWAFRSFDFVEEVE